jgi:AcrR family transcriptional regulator
LGAIECIGRWGWERTTIDDLANAARCSRASVYRKFGSAPKPLILDEVLAAVGADMVLAVDRELEASAGEPGLRHALTAAIVAAANEFENNRTVAELIRTDRKSILPLIAFDRLDPIVKRYSSHLVSLVEPQAGNRADAVAITSWATRMLLSYVFSPTAPKFVLTDPAAVDHLVVTYLLPGFERR